MLTFLIVTQHVFGKGSRQSITRKMAVLADTEEQAKLLALQTSLEPASILICEQLKQGVTTVTIS